jgi:hypothetical protein
LVGFSFFGDPADLLTNDTPAVARAVAVVVEPELVVEGRGVGSVTRIGAPTSRSLSEEFSFSKEERSDEYASDVEEAAVGVPAPTPEPALVVGDGCDCDGESAAGEVEKGCCSGPGLGQNSPRSPSIEILSTRSSPSLTMSLLLSSS